MAGFSISAGVQVGVTYGTDRAWQELGLPGKPPTSVSDLTKIGKTEANKLKREFLEGMGLPPDLDVKLPSELTVEGVKDAAYAAGKVHIEKAIEKATGLPIKLPKKLTLKELERAFGGLFPTDAIEAINMALNIGVQLAASALTSVLAGTAVGSVIPGLGTIVGLAVGLAVAGLRSLFTNVPTHPEGRACEFTTPEIRRSPSGKCEQPPANLDSFQFFTWVSQQMKPVWDGLLEEQRRRACGRGGAINCVRGYSYQRDIAFGISLATVDKLGPAALDAAFAEIERAPEIWSLPAAGAGLGEGAVTFVSGYRGVQPMTQELRPIHNARVRLLGAIQRRRRALQELLVEAGTLDKLPARGNVAPQLRWELLAELQNAAVQVQNRPTDAALGWFTTVAGFVALLEQKQREATAAAVADAAQQLAVVHRKQSVAFFNAWAATDPRKRCLTEADVLRFLQACEQHLAGKLDGKTLRARLEKLVKAACTRMPQLRKVEAAPTVTVEGTPGGVLVRAFAFTGNPFRLFSRERRT